jgi:hypothetical protein
MTSNSSEVMDTIYQFLTLSNANADSSYSRRSLDAGFSGNGCAAQKQQTRPGTYVPFAYDNDSSILGLGDELNLSSYNPSLDSFSLMTDRQQQHIADSSTSLHAQARHKQAPYGPQSAYRFDSVSSSSVTCSDAAAGQKHEQPSRPYWGTVHFNDMLGAPMASQQADMSGRPGAQLIGTQPLMPPQSPQLSMPPSSQLANSRPPPSHQAQPRKSAEMSQLLSLLQSPVAGGPVTKGQQSLTTASNQKAAVKSKMRHASGSKVLQQVCSC